MDLGFKTPPDSTIIRRYMPLANFERVVQSSALWFAASSEFIDSFEGTKTNAAAEVTDLIKGSCSTAVKGAQDYNNKLLEFAQTNTTTAFEFAQRLLGVKVPSEFIELSTEHARKQFATLSDQTRELAALAQKVTLATMSPAPVRIMPMTARSREP